jgi:hypothetical protein
MKISHVTSATQPNFIEVRQYENRLVNITQPLKPKKSDFCSGFWRVKGIDKLPKGYELPNTNNYL